MTKGEPITDVPHTMRAVWLEDRELRVRNDVPVPSPPDDEALVRVLKAGICNTDIELIRGYYPFTGVLGHEFVGTVAHGPEHLVNRRVVGEINAVRLQRRHFVDRRQHVFC